MKKHLLLFFLLCSFLGQAQSVQVPQELYLADQRMILSHGGREEVQKRVDALLKYPKYFQAKVDLADTYFPIVERVFREEGLPDDFKYLVLIESGLVSDAVSTSNAVGFWQFKKDTATDYGLQVNDNIDERKHIVESSRSAARYLLKSNNLYYKNWHNTILSYYHGFTGAKKHTKPRDVDSKEMEVTHKTDPYILKLLAHKIAYEGAIGRNPAPAVVLQEVPVSGRSISDLALEMSVNESELQRYNKWLAGNYIPSDKTYTLIVPVTNPNQQNVILASRRTDAPVASTQTGAPKQNVVTEKVGKREFKKLNGLKVIIAQRGDTKDKLAMQARMSTRRFLSLNDMYSFDPIVEGQAYYIERKKSKAHVQYHVVQAGERVQQIAQQYGVKVKTILWNNRMKSNEVLAAGRLLWMQHRRPSSIPVEFKKTYPGTEPRRTPVKPVILAQDQVLDEINADKSTATSQQPDPGQKPARDYPGGKLSGISSSSAETAAPESSPEAVASEPAATSRPIDLALDHTNEEQAKDETLLTEEIDQQVEHINHKAPLYRKPQTGTSPQVAANASGSGQDLVLAKPSPAQESAPVGKAPNPVVQEPAPASPQTPASPVLQETAAAQPLPAQTPGIHLVAKGETLYGISRKYGITTQQLQQWNSLGDSPLSIGQSLKVVAPAVTSASTPLPAASQPLASATETGPAGGPATHTVATGESMYQISRRYGVTIKDIMEWNGKADFNVIPGEKLLIKTVASSRN
ncbi:MAG: LysM peptidoglycan-binding domain-containing protein [Adhaeribacter sp.]